MEVRLIPGSSFPSASLKFLIPNSFHECSPPPPRMVTQSRNISLLIKWTIWQRGGVRAECFHATLRTSTWFRVSQCQHAWTWWQGWRLRPVTSNKSVSGYQRKSIDHPHPAHFKNSTAWLTKCIKRNKQNVGQEVLGKYIIRHNYSVLCNQCEISLAVLLSFMHKIQRKLQNLHPRSLFLFLPKYDFQSKAVTSKQRHLFYKIKRGK